MKGKKSASKEFEEALNKKPEDRYVLRLSVTGSTPRSARAIQNIRAVCERELKGRYELEVIDIYQQPDRVAQDQVVVAPTLMKNLPLPVRRLIGDLSNLDRVLVGLDLIAHKPSGG